VEVSSYMDSLELSDAAGAQAAVRKAVRKRLRIRGIVIASACWAILIVSACLTPSRTGMGTHRQLGLPACQWLATTGYPCPTCGLTTSMAAMAHARPVLAWKSHPFGVVLFAAVLAAALLGTFEACTGRDAFRHLRPGMWWAWVPILGLLAGWGLKVWIGVSTGRLPLR